MTKQEQMLQVVKQELPQLKAILSLNTQKGTDVETLALQELEYLQTIGLSNPAIYECLPQTIIAAVKSVMKQNLTLDPYAGLVYVKTRNVNIGTSDQKNYAKALEIQPSANGLISIARQCGRILDIDRPEVKKDAAGKVVGVSVKYLVPSYNEAGQKIAKWKTVEFDESDFKRWRKASHNENSRGKSDAATRDYSNPNYSNFNGGPDPEFVRAKAIRHGLKKLGTNPHETRATQIITDVEKKHVVESKADEAAMADDFGHDYIESEACQTEQPTANVELHEKIEL